MSHLTKAWDARRRARLAAWRVRAEAVARSGGTTLTFEVHDDVVIGAIPRLELTDWGEAGAATLTIRVGRGARIGRGVVLEVSPQGDNVFALGEDSEVGDHARFQLRNGTIRIGPRCNVRSFSVLKSEGELDLLGDNLVSYGAVIHCARRIEIGARSGMSERVSIVDSDHGADGSDEFWWNAPLRIDPVTIDENVFIAANAVVMRGTHIGRNSVVAAGSVVTAGQSYEPRSLIAGVPAKLVRLMEGA